MPNLVHHHSRWNKNIPPHHSRGFTIIELLVVLMIFAIIMTTALLVVATSLRQRTKVNFNSQTRSTANDIMMLVTRSIKDAAGIDLIRTKPYSLEAQYECVEAVPGRCNELFPGSRPYCSITQLFIQVNDTTTRSYILLPDDEAIAAVDIDEKAPVDEDGKIISETSVLSPPDLRVLELSYRISPNICYAFDEATGGVIFAEFEQPGKNVTVQLQLKVESPFPEQTAEGEKEDAFKTSTIVIESSATLRNL